MMAEGKDGLDPPNAFGWSNPCAMGDRGLGKEESGCCGNMGVEGKRMSFAGGLRNDILGNLRGKDETGCLGHKEALWLP